jgi:L-ascorbate metabolism protein UlaG (beta-lactamase superfamily)
MKLPAAMEMVRLARLLLVVVGVLWCMWPMRSSAQSPPQFSLVQRTSNHEIALTIVGQSASYYDIEAATDLAAWDVLSTVASGGASSLQYTDSAAPFLQARYYRVQQLAGTNVFTGDHLSTTNGDVIIHPLGHASLVLGWQGKTIFCDPTNSPVGLPKADLVLVTHAHSDHFNTGVINAVRGTNAVIIAPQDVYNQLTAPQKAIARVLGYGASTNLLGLEVEAVAAYNSFHPLGTANAYVLTIGGRRIFVSGDTGNTTEMRALKDIDVAFVCMNQPFTMTVAQATNAVSAFHPKIVYPYHYKDQSGASANATVFKQQLQSDLGIEVRLRKWY